MDFQRVLSQRLRSAYVRLEDPAFLRIAWTLGMHVLHALHALSRQIFVIRILQVTRKWLNWEGEAVAEHLAGELAALEADPRVRSALR